MPDPVWSRGEGCGGGGCGGAGGSGGGGGGCAEMLRIVTVKVTHAYGKREDLQSIGQHGDCNSQAFARHKSGLAA
eukprot:3587554-Rhodomonas_salina.1